MENPSSNDQQMVTLIEPTTHSPIKKIVVLLLLTLLLVLVGVGVWLGVVASATYPKLMSTTFHAQAAITALENRDLAAAKTELENTKSTLATAQSAYNQVGPLRYVPILG